MKKSSKKSPSSKKRPEAKTWDGSGVKWENYRHPDQFGRFLGYEVVRCDERKWESEVRLVIRDVHLSQAGRVHGGVISALFDHAGGAAVFSTLGPRDFCSTVELKVNYFAPLMAGDRLKAVARVVFRGKRLAVVHAYLYRVGEKKPLAMSTSTFNVVVGDR